MLILASLSGIQDYLFDLRESGGKQAKALRFRSLYIQLMSEAIAVRLLRAIELPNERLIFNAAGKLAIDAASLTEIKLKTLQDEVREIEARLLTETQGRLHLNLATTPIVNSINGAYYAASQALKTAKLQPWFRLATASTQWSPTDLITAPPDTEKEATRDALLGQQISKPGNSHILFSDTAAADSEGFTLAGLSAQIATKPSSSAGAHARPLERMARHIPMDPHTNTPVEFAALAKEARGASMLGVLKADADSLGQAIRGCMNNANDLKPLCMLSERLESFFAHTLEQRIRNNPQWSHLYTVFSGGDDMLLVGPWNLVIDFAADFHKLFVLAFKNENLTISAGVSIIKSKYPIRLAAGHAEELLHQAKTQLSPYANTPKDQCAALGQCWKWTHHSQIIQTGKRLADWVDAKIIQRGWLHTLLELTLLRRGERLAHDPTLSPAMASSRLAWHLGRNWPKPDDRDPRKREARQWVDDIFNQFDHFETTQDTKAIYLPTIVRYAMLATRSADRGEND